MAQPDPSHSVPQELISHVHLISSFRYPTMPRLDLNDVAKWLMSAPQVSRDRAPFFWTYLDKPADGTIFLTWQPLQRLGTNFATDGFIWAPPEHVFKQDLVNGLMLEIYYLKAGYIPGEQFTMHTRRRFRFVPVAGHPNPPQPDMSLFIVHYGSSEPGDRLPAQVVPYDERVNAIMQQRHYLLRAGQIRRKEFMLSDRVNWPSLPELTRQQMGPQMLPRGIPQQMAYPTQPTPGPPSKRARHAPSHDGQQGGMPGMSVGEQSVEDEEDITHGDMLDQMTQREISLNRYRQNHEWMEEILSSAYRMNQITPVDLNLGLKGELASLTEGIFTAQGTEVFGPPAEKPYIGRLDPGLADEFRKRIKEYVESTQEEIKNMEAAHTEAMTELKKSSLYAVKEAELRAVAKRAPLEAPQPEGQADPGSEEGWIQSAWARNEEEVTQEIEAAVGRKVEVKPRIKRIQHGGFEAPVPEQTPAPTSAAAAQMSHQMSRAGSQNSGLILGESDIDMGGTAAGLLDQMHTGFSSMTTPVNNFSTPKAQLSAAHSNVVTPSNAPKEPLPATVSSAAAPAAPVLFQPTGDVTMGGTEAPLKRAELKSATPDSDWVVVPKCGETSEARAGQGQATAAATVIGDMPKPVAAVATMVTTKTAGGKPSPAAATPAVTDGGGTANYDQNDFSSLGDLDTPGGALVGFDAPELDGAAGELGDGLDLQMDMEDSAFGDAFHGVDGGSVTPGEGPGQDV